MLRSSIVAASIYIAASISALAAENPADGYAIIATELYQSLPKNATVAIQPLSEEETKIPASILRSVEVGLTSALQRGSDFEVKLIARDRLQTIWKEAREFSNKKFEDMVAEAGAEVLLIGEVRPNADGVEISYRAFRVKGSGTGNVIASSKPRVMAMDWKKELGVQPTQINDTMKEMAEAMKRLAASGGLVSDPKTPAEFYHNARILAQRGEVDLAISSYEQVLKFPIRYADPMDDLITLATRIYGTDGGKVYLEKKIKPFVSEELYLFAKQKFYQYPLLRIGELLNAGSVDFPPLLASFITIAKPLLNNTTFGVRSAVFNAHKSLSASYRDGSFFSFYLDQIRGDTAIRPAIVPLEQMVSSNIILSSFQMPVHISYNFNRQNNKLMDADITIFDAADRKKDILICQHDASFVRTCLDIKSRVVRATSDYGSHESGSGKGNSDWKRWLGKFGQVG